MPHADAPISFYLGESDGDRAQALSAILAKWKFEAGRHDVQKTNEYLSLLVTNRSKHVQDWLDTNLSRFPQDNSDIIALRQDVSNLTTSLASSIQLCQARCTTCYLRCMNPRSHGDSEHSCGTSHTCLAPCDFNDEHRSPEFCGFQ